MHVCMYVCTCVCMSVCLSVWVCMCVTGAEDLSPQLGGLDTNMHDCGVRACTYTCSHFWTHTYTCAYTFRTVGTIRIACPDNTSACRKRIWIGCVPTMAPAFRPGRPRIRASFLLAIVHILVLSSGSRTVNGTTYIRISCMHASQRRVALSTSLTYTHTVIRTSSYADTHAHTRTYNKH